MFHTSVIHRKSLFKLYSHRLVPTLAILFFGLFCTISSNATAQSTNMIKAVQADSSGQVNTIWIKTSAEPAYTVYELFNPSRIVVDIANTAIQEGSSINIPKSLPISLTTTSVTETTPSLTRLEFAFDNPYSTYNVRTVHNDIQLSVTMNNIPNTTASTPKSGNGINALINEKQGIASKLPRASLKAGNSSMESDDTSSAASESLRRSFSFGGYDKTRISVDFYKIDLHNVFRLFREISGVNLIVDQSVGGSLTLALNDVPWDFALDIILNLKGLQKEERFNTIIILPQNKEFSWPERAEDNLDFEADEGVAVKEAIVIQQQMNITPEMAEAKKLIQKGREAEKKGNFEDAIAAYSEAFDKWPDNERLANKISSIYLVYLRQNARAVHFAKQALEINNENTSAALNAAIALANMHEYKEAQQYFSQSVSVEKPSQEALLSYAVFNEEQGQYEAAIKLINKYESLYGANLDSMIAAARILDKQGSQDEATEKYKAILLSGLQIPPDLRKYINSRIALNQ